MDLRRRQLFDRAAMMTAEDIELLRTPNGGWTKAQLAQWGVPWPPPKGWKRKLLKSS